MAESKKTVALSLPEDIANEIALLKESDFNSKTDAEILEELIRIGLDSTSNGREGE